MYRAVYTRKYLLPGLEGQGQARSTGTVQSISKKDAQNLGGKGRAQNGVSILYNDNDPS